MVIILAKGTGTRTLTCIVSSHSQFFLLQLVDPFDLIWVSPHPSVIPRIKQKWTLQEISF